jgi:hypothetical protein
MLSEKAGAFAWGIAPRLTCSGDFLTALGQHLPVRGLDETCSAMAAKAARGRETSSQQTRGPKRRNPSYYLVAGVALEKELDRMRALKTFAAGRLAQQRPLLKVRRATKRPNRLGFAVPSQFRLSLTAYPGIRPGDVLETLLHELVHLHVGRSAEPHAWHGPTFKNTLAAAFEEGYGISVDHPPTTRHGFYAEEIERRLLMSGSKSQAVFSGSLPAPRAYLAP